jgi:HK97 family phage portal protein
MIEALREAWGAFKAARRPKSPTGGGNNPPWFANGPAGAPLVGAWTDSRYEQVRHYKHWVYVAVSKICDKVASSLPNVSVVRDTANPERLLHAKPDLWLPPGSKSKALAPLQVHEELEPVDNDHPLVKLLRDANDVDSGHDLWYETTLYLQLTGNGYWWAPQNNAGLPVELWCIPSHWVWPVPGRDRIIDHYQVRPVEGAFGGVKIPADDVIHFRRKNPTSKLDGFSPTSAGARWIDGAESVDQTRWHTFKNGPMPGLKVEFTEINPSEELMNRIEARLQSRYAGEINAGKPLLVPKGAKVDPYTMTAKELDFCKSADQLRDSILALYGVPPVVAGITKNMTYGSVLAAQAGFCTFTVNPFLSFLGQALTERLAARFDEKLRVWWPDQSPDDPAVRNRDLALEIQAGSVSKNEIRAQFGRKRRPEAEADELLPGQYDAAGEAAPGGSAPGDKTKPKKKPKPKNKP